MTDRLLERRLAVGGPKRRDLGRLRTRLVAQWLRRAAAHEARGELGEAIGSYRAVLVIEPLHLEARELLVVALLRGRRTGDAIAELGPSKTALQRVGAEPARAALRRIDAAARSIGGLEVALEVAALTTQLGFVDDARQRLRAVYRQLMAEGRIDEARALAKWHPEAMQPIAAPGKPRTRGAIPPVGRVRPTATPRPSPPPIPLSAMPTLEDLDAEATAIYEPPVGLVSPPDNGEDTTAVVPRKSNRALTAAYGVLVRAPYYGPDEAAPLSTAPAESRERTAIQFGTG